MNMAGCLFLNQKINLWSYWKGLLCLSRQRFVIVTLNMLLVTGIIFWIQQDLRYIYLWSSLAWWIWLVTYSYHQNQLVEWLAMLASCLKKALLYFQLWYIIDKWKIIFKNSKNLRLVYLWASVASEIWLVKYFEQKTFTCGVTGDVCFMFQVKASFYSLSTCYCSLEHYFSEVKKMYNSFTYELQ